MIPARPDHDQRSPTVLVVDDDEANRRLLGALLRRTGYAALEAPDGEAALLAVVDFKPDLVILDIQMPRLDGIAVTRRLRSRPETAALPIILLTGLGSVTDKVAGLGAGATDFVTKPFDAAELLARVGAALRLKAVFDRLEDAQSVLVALANAVEAKDPTTEKHCGRLTALAKRLARSAGLGETIVEAIGYGATLHDVGKIGVPEALLRKPGPLSDDERLVLQQHPALGAAIVEPLRLGRVVGPIVRGHHEWWNGHGYPDRLEREAIPIGARVVAIVDAFDAITHDRPYRRSRSIAVARAELLAGAGSQFDPDLVEVFVADLDEGSVWASEAVPHFATLPRVVGVD